MGFTEALTIALVILKALGYLHLSWWLVFTPEIVVAVLYLIVLFLTLVVGVNILKGVRRLCQRYL